VTPGAPKSTPPAAPQPETPAAFFEAGLRLLRAGQFADAEQCGRKALAVEPRHADSLHLMGLLALLAKQYDLAIEWFALAIRQNPDAPDYFFNLGGALQQCGRLDDAIAACDRGLTLRPDYADGWFRLGELLRQQKRVDEAIASFDRVLQLNPLSREAANSAALLAFEAGRHELALIYFDRSIAIDSSQAGAFKFKGLCEMDLKNFDAALSSCMKAVELAPDNAEMNNNAGFVLQKFGRHAEAIEFFGAAVARDPMLAAAWDNRSTSMTELHRFEEARADIDRAIALDPECADYRWNRALLLLLTGDFSGWVEREWGRRCARLPFVDRKFSKPRWRGGELIAGKTILLHGDEALGDTIQYSRYATKAAALGARVILEVDPSLQPLLSGIEGVSLCLSKTADGALPDFDLHCPLSGLPLACETRLDTIPASPCYLPPPPRDRIEAWRARLGLHDRLRVGLVWSGNPAHNNDRNRSMPLSTLASILDCEATFVSLQKEPRPEDKATLRDCVGLIDLTGQLSGFVETAALVSCLDLVITVDTSVAHLAAALGRPTWILLPYTPDYRWMLDRDDSPWYPTARLFRQDERRDYVAVVERVRDELNGLIAAFRPN
jgi:tetratricopeptide (TPR) repeat protein